MYSNIDDHDLIEGLVGKYYDKATARDVTKHEMRDYITRQISIINETER